MNIPNDPFMLLSYINTQLRDNYSDFYELCNALDVSAEAVTNTLAAIDYHYDKTRNRFV